MAATKFENVGRKLRLSRMESSVCPVGKFIFRLRMYILSLRMYISKLRMCILNLKIKKLAA